MENKSEHSKNPNKYNSISLLMLVRIIPVIMVIVFAVFAIIFTIIKSSYSSQLVSLMNSDCERVSNKIEVWSNECRDTLELIAIQYENGHFVNNENYTSYMHNFGKTLVSGSEGVYIVFNQPDGKTLSHDREEYFPEYLSTDWFNFALGCDEASFDKCSFYEADNDFSVTCAKNLKDENGKVYAIAASDLYFADIRNVIAEESHKINSSFMLIDNKSGIVLSASDDAFVGKNRHDAEDKFLLSLLDSFDGKDGNKNIKTSKGDYVVTISGIDGTEWYLMLYESSADAYKSLTDVLLVLVLAALIIFLIIALTISQTVRSMMKGLKKTASDIDVMTDGDLAIEFDLNHKGADNEITNINKNLNAYVSKMRTIISRVNTTSEGLRNNASDFDAMATGISDATDVEKQSLEELTSEMKTINDSIQKLSADSQSLSKIAEETTVSSSDAKSYMETVRSDSEETASNLNKVTERMHIAQESMSNLLAHVATVENSAEQISSITSVIKDIASQTNLLSLNASIEAARAGTAGKGFAVVAEEIKKLADTSNENAGMIENLISNISDLMSKTAEASRKSADDITNGVEILEKISGAYGNTVEQVKATGAQINKMLENAKEIDEISGRMEEAATIQANGTKTMLSNTIEIGQMLQEAQEQSTKLKAGASILKDSSAELQKQIEFFKISQES